MENAERRFYLTVITLQLAAILVLSVSALWPGNSPFSICLFQTLTDLPCFSCGTTRAMASLAEGNFAASVGYNPLGLVLAFGFPVVALWAFRDMAAENASLYRLWKKHYRGILIVTFALLAVNWVVKLV